MRIYFRSAFTVFTQKRIEPRGSENIVSLAKGETPYEMGSVEVKQPVVEYRIGSVGYILYPYGGMSVKFIDGFAGFTCKQICVYTVILCLDSLKQQGECSQKYGYSLLH